MPPNDRTGPVSGGPAPNTLAVGALGVATSVTQPSDIARGRTDWPSIIQRAAEIVLSYDTSVTLRQLFYRLVSEQTIPNTTTAYKRLSALTAQARRANNPSGEDIDRDFVERTDCGTRLSESH